MSHRVVDGEITYRISVRIPGSLRHRITAAAAQPGYDISRVVRDALEHYMHAHHPYTKTTATGSSGRRLVGGAKGERAVSPRLKGTS